MSNVLKATGNMSIDFTMDSFRGIYSRHINKHMNKEYSNIDPYIIRSIHGSELDGVCLTCFQAKFSAARQGISYEKKITNYDNLIEKVENEILHSLKGFVLCSWYNNWTSIIIEDIFKDHERVLPTVVLIKQVDFFIDDIPFDLKVTYFPKDFMKYERRKRKLTINELSELKKTAKRFNLPFDQNRPDDELLIDLITAFAESSQQDVKDFYDNFVKIRRDIINDTLKQPRELLRWLYENQGSQRFDASNRLFLVLVDTNSLEDSWKLKRDYTLLKNKIDEYLNTRSFNKDELLLNWSFNNNQYQSYADVLFVLK